MWLSMRPSDSADPENSANGNGVITFSVVMAYIALIFKFIMSFVYWRTSIDFAEVIDQKHIILK
jgi:uncharacterized membrane protein (DUF485 family)